MPSPHWKIEPLDREEEGQSDVKMVKIHAHVYNIKIPLNGSLNNTMSSSAISLNTNKYLNA